MPCAFLTIWNVRGEYLDMCLIQRSGDMITASGAGGVNEVQYACLQMMIAKATGYKPGKFTHFVANEQIYDRHIDAANELIKRADDCKLELTSHYDYEFTSVKMNFNLFSIFSCHRISTSYLLLSSFLQNLSTNMRGCC